MGMGWFLPLKLFFSFLKLLINFFSFGVPLNGRVFRCISLREDAAATAHALWMRFDYRVCSGGGWLKMVWFH